MDREYAVNVVWDVEAHVFVATSDDVAGLAIEAKTEHELIKKLSRVVPELQELNSGRRPDDHTPIKLRLALRLKERLVMCCGVVITPPAFATSIAE